MPRPRSRFERLADTPQPLGTVTSCLFSGEEIERAKKSFDPNNPDVQVLFAHIAELESTLVEVETERDKAHAMVRESLQRLAAIFQPVCPTVSINVSSSATPANIEALVREAVESEITNRSSRSNIGARRVEPGLIELPANPTIQPSRGGPTGFARLDAIEAAVGAERAERQLLDLQREGAAIEAVLHEALTQPLTNRPLVGFRAQTTRQEGEADGVEWFQVDENQQRVDRSQVRDLTRDVLEQTRSVLEGTMGVLEQTQGVLGAEEVRQLVNQPIDGVSGPHSVRVDRIMADIATSDFRIEPFTGGVLRVQAQDAYVSSTGTNRNGGNIILQAGRHALGGRPGEIQFFIGDEQVLSFRDSGVYVYGHLLTEDVELVQALRDFMHACCVGRDTL